jgi:hypothetical protein
MASFVQGLQERFHDQLVYFSLGIPTPKFFERGGKHASGFYVTQYIDRLRDKANADDLIRMKIDELLLELSANKTEEAEEQKHEFEKQLEERILEGSHETLLKQEKNNIKYTNEIYDDFGLFD